MKRMQNLNFFIRILILIAFLICLNTIDFGIKTGYFKSDIESFQSSLEVYNKYVAGIFVFISFLFLIFRNSSEIKPKNPNIIFPEFLKHTPFIIFITIALYVNFHKTATDFSLIINKQKQISTVEREFKIDLYIDKRGELALTEDKFDVKLGIIVEQLDFYKMNKEIYKSLEDKKNIKLKFKTGLLGIPFEPEYKK